MPSRRIIFCVICRIFRTFRQIFIVNFDVKNLFDENSRMQLQFHSVEIYLAFFVDKAWLFLSTIYSLCRSTKLQQQNVHFQNSFYFFAGRANFGHAQFPPRGENWAWPKLARGNNLMRPQSLNVVVSLYCYYFRGAVILQKVMLRKSHVAENSSHVAEFIFCNMT